MHLLDPVIHSVYPHDPVFDDGIQRFLVLIGAAPGLGLFRLLQRSRRR
jgi:hypothetical protein